MTPMPAARTVDLVSAGQQIGISRTYAYQLAKQGIFPVRVLRIGRLYRVSQEELDRYLAGGGE